MLSLIIATQLTDNEQALPLNDTFLASASTRINHLMPTYGTRKKILNVAVPLGVLGTNLASGHNSRYLIASAFLLNFINEYSQLAYQSTSTRLYQGLLDSTTEMLTQLTVSSALLGKGKSTSVLFATTFLCALLKGAVQSAQDTTKVQVFWKLFSLSVAAHLANTATHGFITPTPSDVAMASCFAAESLAVGLVGYNQAKHGQFHPTTMALLAGALVAQQAKTHYYPVTDYCRLTPNIRDLLLGQDSAQRVMQQYLKQSTVLNPMHKARNALIMAQFDVVSRCAGLSKEEQAEAIRNLLEAYLKIGQKQFPQPSSIEQMEKGFVQSMRYTHKTTDLIQEKVNEFLTNNTGWEFVDTVNATACFGQTSANAAIVYYHPKQHELLIGFRGTRGKLDSCTDILTLPRSNPNPLLDGIHFGFRKYEDSMHDALVRMIQERTSSDGKKPTTFVLGHSLGGSVAWLFTALLLQDKVLSPEQMVLRTYAGAFPAMGTLKQIKEIADVLKTIDHVYYSVWGDFISETDKTAYTVLSWLSMTPLDKVMSGLLRVHPDEILEESDMSLKEETQEQLSQLFLTGTSFTTQQHGIATFKNMMDFIFQHGHLGEMEKLGLWERCRYYVTNFLGRKHSGL